MIKKLAIICLALAVTFCASADTWTDPATGITWTYTVSNGEVSLGGGSYSSTAIPATTSGAVTIPASINGMPVTTIAVCAFFGCNSLTGLTIPDSVRNIVGQAFLFCESLTELTIPDSVVKIGSNAFGYCSSLESVVIGSGTTSIGSYCFGGCSSLKTITIPDNVVEIGNYAFRDCSSLESVVIGSGTTWIDSYCFSGCSSLKTIAVSDDNPSYSSHNNLLYNKDGTELIVSAACIETASIPETVTDIAPLAFSGCTNLTELTIPDSVVKIGNYAFQYCSSLESVVIGSGTTSIGSDCFSGCSSLKTITVSDDNPSYSSRNNLLCNKDGTELIVSPACIETVSIPETITDITSSAFSDCTNLTELIIPNSVTNIGSSAFKDCSSLESIVIGSGTTSIGSDCFSGCSSLKTITVSDDNLNYADYDGLLCSKDKTILLTFPAGLTTVNIPESVTRIESHAFNECNFIESVVIPNHVTNVMYRAFLNCSSLMSVSIPQCVCDGSTYGKMNAVFSNYSSITNVVFQEGITKIGEEAFKGCNSLETISIPNSVISIDSTAFKECYSLKNISMCQFMCDSTLRVIFPDSYQTITNAVINDGVVSLNGEISTLRFGSSDSYRLTEGTFSGCRSLENVDIPDSVAIISSSTFDGTPIGTRLICDAISKSSANDDASGGGESGGGSVVASEAVALTVTNVVVHFVTQSLPSDAVIPSTTAGIVNVITEVNSGSAIAITSEWATQYEGFEAKFGSDFTAAITAVTGKFDGAGKPMMVWQDYVAGTDPTDPADTFKASITFDKETNEPIISWTPELSATEAAKRSYKTYGKVKLTDADWTLVNGDAANYNFFKVTVEMK